MKLTPRPYQQEAIDRGVVFFKSENKENALLVLPTAAGKSLIISEIANALDTDILVFQPSLEILVQNLEKMRMYTDDCSAYSASANEKIVSKITFATIGSVKEHIDEFKHFHYILIDEAHLVGTDESTMYLKFLSMLDCKVLGLTATPYRLSSDTKFDFETRKMRSVNARITMLTNEDNAFFKKMLYVVQVKDMIEQGFLCKPTYFDVRPKYWDERKIFANSMGSDYSEKSVQWMMEKTNMNQHVVNLCRRLFHPKDGKPRNGILVFVQFVEDAEEIHERVADSAIVTGQTTKKNRERIINEFKEGKIKVLLNVNAVTTGFDYPALDTIIMARPTMSLSLYSQIVGRVVRKFDGKNAWVIDCVGNTRRFGYMENLYITKDAQGKYETFGWVEDYDTRRYEWKQLTGVILNPENKK